MTAADRQAFIVYQQLYLLRFFYILRLYQIHKALGRCDSLEKESGTDTGLLGEIAPTEKDPTGHISEDGKPAGQEGMARARMNMSPSERKLAADGNAQAAMTRATANQQAAQYKAEVAAVKDALFKYPTQYKGKTDYFGPRIARTTLQKEQTEFGEIKFKGYSDHTGVDLAGKRLDPIRSAAKGTVEFAGENGGYGYQVRVRHVGGYVSSYSHLDEKPVLKVGQNVDGETIVGKLGSSGASTGPHLHYEIRKDGVPLDPTPGEGSRNSKEEILKEIKLDRQRAYEEAKQKSQGP